MAVWVIRAGRMGENEEFALNNGVYSIGFDLYQSVTDFTDYEALRNHIQDTQFPDSINRAAAYASQLWRFAHEFKIGEMIVLPRRQPKVIAVGKIVGDYVYEPSDYKAPLPHTRKVEWHVQDIPRANFDQDLNSSFNSRLTISQVGRNNAEARIKQTLSAYLDEESSAEAIPPSPEPTDDDKYDEIALAGLEEPGLIDPRIIERIRQKFQRHELERLVESILKAEGYTTMRTAPGPDGGADILAGSGKMGLDSPKLCVQVKSGASPVGISDYNRLQGNVHGFGADYGLLVSSRGFTQALLRENRRHFFEIRLWGPDELVEKVLDTYDNLPLDIRTDIPLQSIRVLL